MIKITDFGFSKDINVARSFINSLSTHGSNYVAFNYICNYLNLQANDFEDSEENFNNVVNWEIKIPEDYIIKLKQKWEEYLLFI